MAEQTASPKIAWGLTTLQQQTQVLNTVAIQKQKNNSAEIQQFVYFKERFLSLPLG